MTMTHATPTSPGHMDEPRVPIVAGDRRQDLERVAHALATAGIFFEVEEGKLDPEHGLDWRWRVKIRPSDLARAREVLGALQEAPEVAPRGTDPPGGPLYEMSGQDWLRNLLVLACLGAGIFLLLTYY